MVFRDSNKQIKITMNKAIREKEMKINSMLINPGITNIASATHVSKRDTNTTLFWKPNIKNNIFGELKLTDGIQEL